MTDIYNQIIEILNNDPETQKIMTDFKNAAIRTGASVEEYNKAKEVMFLACLKHNEQAWNLYSEWMFNGLNNH